MPSEPKRVQPSRTGSDQGNAGEGRRVGLTHGASSRNTSLTPDALGGLPQVGLHRLKRPLSKMSDPLRRGALAADKMLELDDSHVRTG